MARETTFLLLQACVVIAGQAAPAVVTSKTMYAYWCEKNPTTIVCKHHGLVHEMIQEKDPSKKKEIQLKIQTLGKTAKDAGGTLHQQLTEGYQTMKLAYCATSPKGAKTLCSTAASQYKTGGASTRPWRRSSSSSSMASSTTSVSAWYCANTANKDEPMCKRAAIMAKMRVPGLSAEERKAHLASLREVPVVYASTQAVYADYCKVAEHTTSTTCSRLKHTQSTRNMREWYCAQPTSAESMWCKRQAILDKMQKLPGTSTDPQAIAVRKGLSEQFSQFSKRPEGGGPSPISSIAKEIAAAKKAYCALDANKDVTFCKMPSSSSTIGGLSSRFRSSMPSSMRPMSSSSRLGAPRPFSSSQLPTPTRSRPSSTSP